MYIINRKLLAGAFMMLGMSGALGNVAFAADNENSIEELVATFDIPQDHDEGTSLNSDYFTPFDLYYKYKQDDPLRTVFSIFSGEGRITYSYQTPELMDVDGTVYYPYWLLGFDNAGGDITFDFTQDYITQYGVNISKVVIEAAQNRFSKSPLNVTVNGVTQQLEYTPNSNNIPAGNTDLQSSRDMEFIFTKAEPVSKVTISCANYGMGFSAIKFYVGEPQEEEQITTLVFSGITENGIMQQGYSTLPITLLPILIQNGDKTEEPANGLPLTYTITDAAGVQVTKIDTVTGQSTEYEFEQDGRYTVTATLEDEKSATYVLELYIPLDSEMIFGGEINDGIMRVQDFLGENREEGELRDWSSVQLFELPEGVELYYHLSKDENFLDKPSQDQETPEYIRKKTEQADSDDSTANIPEGYTKYDHETGIDLNDNNQIDIITSHNGVLSPKQTFHYTTINVPVKVKSLSDNDIVIVRSYRIDGSSANGYEKGLIIDVMSDGSTVKTIRK